MWLRICSLGLGVSEGSRAEARLWDILQKLLTGRGAERWVQGRAEPPSMSGASGSRSATDPIWGSGRAGRLQHLKTRLGLGSSLVLLCISGHFGAPGTDAEGTEDAGVIEKWLDPKNQIHTKLHRISLMHVCWRVFRNDFALDYQCCLRCRIPLSCKDMIAWSVSERSSWWENVHHKIHCMEEQGNSPKSCLAVIGRLKWNKIWDICPFNKKRRGKTQKGHIFHSSLNSICKKKREDHVSPVKWKIGFI